MLLIFSYTFLQYIDFILPFFSSFLNLYRSRVSFSPESPCPKLGDIVVAEVNLDKDFEVVESTLVDRLIIVIIFIMIKIDLDKDF